MPNFGESILSKVLDDGNVLPLREHDITTEDFSTETEKEVHEFVMSYASTNRGKTPDYRTVVEKFPDFYYREGVVDEYRYLVRELKSFTAKRKMAELFAGDGKNVKSLQERINSTDGNELLYEIMEQMRSISQVTLVRDKVGVDIKNDAGSFKGEYDDRKAGISIRVWHSKFATLNREMGGYYSGNMYSWFGRSGRGKSVFVMEEALESAMQGAVVLVWAMEMGRYEWMARAYSSLSARLGIFHAKLNGIAQDVGFQNRALLSGDLTEEQEEALEQFLLDLNEVMPGTVILRSVDDEDFDNRTLRELESDIIRTSADVVVIDPFYYLQYEKNTSRTAGGDASETSKRMRALAGRTRTVIHVITQSDEDGQQSDDERELNPPARSSVKKTKSILEDATNLFSIDTVDGVGVIQIGKGRSGGEGARAEIVYLPNFGIVKEMSEELASIAGELGF